MEYDFPYVDISLQHLQSESSLLYWNHRYSLLEHLQILGIAHHQGRWDQCPHRKQQTEEQ